MSTECKTVYERGKFFIETGTAKNFSTIFNNKDGMVKYIPNFMFKRIEDLMKSGDKDKATTLWMKVCERASMAKWKSILQILDLVFKVIVAGMAFYAFLKVIS